MESGSIYSEAESLAEQSILDAGVMGYVIELGETLSAESWERLGALSNGEGDPRQRETRSVGQWSESDWSI